MKKKDKIKSFRINEETDNQIEYLMNKYGLNLSDTLNKIIKDVYGTQELAQPENCPVLVYLDGEGYFCAENPTKPRLIGNGKKEHSDKLCAVCQKYKGLMDEIKHRKETTTIEIPICNHPEHEYARDYDYKKYVNENPLSNKLNWLLKMVCEYEDNFYCHIKAITYKHDGSITFNICNSLNHGKPCKYFGWIEIDLKDLREETSLKWKKQIEHGDMII